MDLMGCDITSIALAALGDQSFKLRHISLNFCRITDIGVLLLTRGCRALQTVDFTGHYCMQIDPCYLRERDFYYLRFTHTFLLSFFLSFFLVCYIIFVSLFISYIFIFCLSLLLSSLIYYFLHLILPFRSCFFLTF
jgi:hypothetical protein